MPAPPTTSSVHSSANPKARPGRLEHGPAGPQNVGSDPVAGDRRQAVGGSVSGGA